MNVSLHVRARLVLALGFAGAAPLAGCTDTSVVVGGLQEVTALRAIPNRDLDLLFVIDDSPSMSDKQVALAAAFPMMIDVLSSVDGGLPNIHLGVITTDMGTSSSGSAPGAAIGQTGTGGCAGHGKDGALIANAATPEHFLSDVAGPNGTRVRNYTGDLPSVFSSLALVGAGGCGFEQPLSAMSRALTNPANSAFFRPEANLAVVILSDEDDCSAKSADLFAPESPALGALQSFRCFRHGVTCDQDSNSPGGKTHCAPAPSSSYIDDVTPFVAALTAQKPDPRMLMVSAIVGDPSPVEVALASPPQGGPAIPTLGHSCSFTGSDGPTYADPAVRLAAFVDAFPGRGTLTSVCSNDLSDPLHAIGQSAKRLIGDPCLDTTRLADTAVDEPGVQPSCEVVDLRDQAPNAPTVLPACASGAPDCYELVADASACPATQDHVRVRIHRTAVVAADTWTHVRCQLAP